MKITALASVLVLSISALSRAGASSVTPVYEETFNVSHGRLRLANGATLGGPSSGLSGKSGDRAYVAVPRSTEQEAQGPVAYAVEPIMPVSLPAFTCAFWYFLEERTPDLMVLAEPSGVGFFVGDKGLEIRLSNATSDERPNVFSVGPRGAWHEWRTSGKWTFLVVSWEQAANRMVIRQGTLSNAAAIVREMQRPAPATPLAVRDSLASRPETLGNTYSTRHDRPLAGRLDNFRLFDRLLSEAEIEKLRQADIANAPISLK